MCVFNSLLYYCLGVKRQHSMVCVNSSTVCVGPRLICSTDVPCLVADVVHDVSRLFCVQLCWVCVVD